VCDLFGGLDLKLATERLASELLLLFELLVRPAVRLVVALVPAAILRRGAF